MCAREVEAIKRFFVFCLDVVVFLTEDEKSASTEENA